MYIYIQCVKNDNNNYYYSHFAASNYRFAKSHEWVSLEGDVATVGISNHAQDSLGEAVYVDMPDVETSFNQGGTYACGNSICEHNAHTNSIGLSFNKQFCNF